MKNLLFYFHFCFFTISLSAQPSIEWQKSFGGSQYDYLTYLQPTMDGGYVVAGQSKSNDGDIVGAHGEEDWWVMKLNKNGDIQWTRALGGSYWEGSPYIQQARDGGLIVFGTTESIDGDVTSSHGGSEIWVVKLDLLGNIVWETTVGGSANDGVYKSLLETSDGGYILAGSSRSNNGDVPGNYGSSDFFIVKLSNLGIKEWAKVYGGSKQDFPQKIIQTLDGGYVVAGATQSNDGDVTISHGSVDFWVIKISSNGVLEWEKAMGGSNPDYFKDIAQTNDGGYIAVGGTSSTDGDVVGLHGSGDFWAVKLSGTGTLQWQKTYGGSDFDEAYSIQKADDEGFIISGPTFSTDGDVTGAHGDLDNWVIKIDSAGTILWEKCLGGTGSDLIYTITTLNDGGYMLAGESSSNDGDVPGNQGFDDAWILRLSSAGEILWKKSMGGSKSDLAFQIEPAPDEGYIVAAQSYSNNGDATFHHGGGDFWIIKLSPDLVGVEDNEYHSQANYLEVFPNPSTGKVFIKLSFEEPSLSVQISNLLGQQLSQQTIPNGGSLDISSLPNGIYSILATTPSGKVFSNKISKQE